jgi:hypothetical protein
MQICDLQLNLSGHLLRTARLDAEKYYFVSDAEAIIAGLRRTGQRVDLFTFVQSVSEREPKYKYPMEWDNFAVLPVSTFEHWWEKQLGFKARNKAKQAEKKGVEIRETPFDQALARGICEIYNESPIRQGRRFAHYGKNLDTVYREAATYLPTSTFIGAYLGEELIGFIKLVADPQGRQAGLMNIISKIQHRDKAPTNALVAHAVRACAKRGIPHLVYSNYAYANKEKDSVADFKERNGFLRYDVPRYYVPLTPVGAAGFRLGFHHRLVDRFPEAWTSRIREFRRNWYARRVGNLSEAS